MTPTLLHRCALRRGSLALGVASMVFALVPAVLRAQEARAGTVSVLWGDPREGLEGRDPAARPRHRFMVVEASGTVRELLLEDVPLGGRAPESMDQHRLSYRLPAGARRDIAVRPSLMQDLGPASLAAGDAPATSASAAAPLMRPIAIVRCQFPDTTAANLPSASAVQAFWTGGRGSISDWYEEVTQGAFSLDGSTVVASVMMPHPRTTYIVNNSANLTRLSQDCISAADPAVDFSPYWGIVAYYSAALDCCSWGGRATLTVDGATRNVPFNWNASWAGPGTSIHELGHALGLPHSSSQYGRVYDSRWDVMSASSWFRLDPTSNPVGAHFVAWHKDRLGLVSPQRRVVPSGTSTRIIVERTAIPGASARPLLIEIPLADPQQKYVVEVRRRVGYDAGLPGEGVLISHVLLGRGTPAQVIDGDGNGDVNDDGALWTPGETFADERNDVEVRVESTDGTGFRVVVRNGRGIGVTLAKAPRVDTLLAGLTGPPDSVTVQLGIAGTRWSASTVASWIELLTSSGNASEQLRWRVRPGSVPPGSYTDSIAVNAGAGGTGHVRVGMLLRGDMPVAALTRGSARDSIMAGGTSFRFVIDSAYLVTRDSVASWTASVPATGSSYLALYQRVGSSLQPVGATRNGTGHGWIYFLRSIPSGSAAGTLFRDSVVVRSGDARIALHDTVRVIAPPPLTVARAGPWVPVAAGASGYDSVTVVGSANHQWQVSRGAQSYIIPSVTITSGSRVLIYERSGRTRAPGTYVDTLRFSYRTGGPVVSQVDTMVVVPATEGITVSSSSRRAMLLAGSQQSMDSVYVTFGGTTAASASWMFASSKGRAYAVARGSPHPATGSGWLVWSRASGFAVPGLYVDTLTITPVGFVAPPVTVLDSVYVEKLFQLAATGLLRSAVFAGSPDPAPDTITIALTGRNAGTTPWRAVSSSSHTEIAGGGTGSGPLIVRRRLASLAKGTHVDTVRILTTERGEEVERLVIVDTLHVVQTPTITQSAGHLLGTTSLSAPELRAMDGIGNRDGTYNLGDLLALLDRTGQSLDAGLIERLLALPPESRHRPAAAAAGASSTTSTTPSHVP